MIAPNVNSFDFTSVSGDLSLTASSTPNDGSVDSVSGSFTLYLPGNAEFAIEMDSLSGDFQSEFEMTSHGDSHDATYICGNDDKTYSIDTVSGDVNIQMLK